MNNVEASTHSELIRQLEKSDYNELTDFLEERTEQAFVRDFWLDRFEHFWDKNPARTDDIPRGWILRDGGGRIGGFFGNIAVRYQVHGQEAVFCSASSWYMGNDFKQKSLELLMPFLQQKRWLLDTTPSEVVAHILLKLGFQERKGPGTDAAFIIPVNSGELLRYFAHKKISWKWLLKTLQTLAHGCRPLDWLLRTLFWWRLSTAGKDYSFREIRCFTDDYSALWDAFRKRHSILAVRDEASLNWLFFGSEGLRATRKVIEVRCGGDLLGYAGVKLVASAVRGSVFHHYELVDCVMLNDDPSGVRTALKGLLWLAEKSEKKIAFVRWDAFAKAQAEVCRRAGFFRITSRARFLFKPFRADAAGSETLSASAFHASPLDGDACFFP